MLNEYEQNEYKLQYADFFTPLHHNIYQTQDEMI